MRQTNFECSLVLLLWSLLDGWMIPLFFQWIFLAPKVPPLSLLVCASQAMRKVELKEEEERKRKAETESFTTVIMLIKSST